MMASYNMDCDCQFSLNALNYNLAPPYKKTSIPEIFISCRPPYSVFVQALHFWREKM